MPLYLGQPGKQGGGGASAQIGDTMSVSFVSGADMAKGLSYVARNAAMAAGLKTYIGKDCPAGHGGERFVSNCGCVTCITEQPNTRAKTHRCVEREQARLAGRVRYFSGRPCLYGHIGERYVRDDQCIACHMEKERTKARLSKPIPTRAAPSICECCGQPPTTRGMHLDHDHVTNEFRGWLCHRCNTGIGLLGDSLAGIEAAAGYLRRAS